MKNRLLFLTIAALVGGMCISCYYSETKAAFKGTVTEERNVGSFKGIKVCCGIDVDITMGDEERVIVEGESDDLEHVDIKVSSGILKIKRTKFNIFTDKISVHVTAKLIESVNASSGCKITSNNEIVSDILKIEASSGSSINLIIKSKYTTCDASSGSDIDLSGSSVVLTTNNSSGADINAKELIVETAKTDGSSGSSTKVNVTKEIEGKTTSGASVRVYGNPQIKNTSTSSGGDFNFK